MAKLRHIRHIPNTHPNPPEGRELGYLLLFGCK